MLFKKTEKLIEYAELVSTVNFNSIKPTIRMVEEQHIIPMVGNELYSALNTTYAANTDEGLLSTADKLLLDKCRSVIGPMVCYYYSVKAEIKISDAGAQRLENATNKTAYQYQVTRYREQNLQEGEMASELLLSFLEDNKGSYPQWVASSAFAKYRDLFIKSGKEFQDLFPSQSPYRNYWAMRSKMQDVEENNIRAEIGSVLFDALKETARSSTETFSDKETDLLKKLKKSIAYFTVAFSIPFLNVRIDANGITVATSNRTGDDEKSIRSAAGNPALNSIITKCQDAGAMWLKNAVKFLNDNPDDFEGWPIEAAVSAEMQHTLVTKDCFNEERTGSFGMF